MNPDTLAETIDGLEGVLATSVHRSPGTWVEVAFERSRVNADLETLADERGLTFRTVGMQDSDLSVGALRRSR